jgi:phage tail-like protein
MPTRPGDPFANNHFQVEIDGIANLDFAEVVLPEARVDVIEYREGADRTSHKVIGTLHYSNLVLRRGVSASNDLFLWWRNVANGIADRRNIGVTLLDAEFQPVKRWAIGGVWPASYAVAPLVAVGEAVALIETLECAAETFDLVV